MLSDKYLSGLYQEVVGADKDETAATTAAGETSPALAPPAFLPLDSKVGSVRLRSVLDFPAAFS